METITYRGLKINGIIFSAWNRNSLQIRMNYHLRIDIFPFHPHQNPLPLRCP